MLNEWSGMVSAFYRRDSVPEPIMVRREQLIVLLDWWYLARYCSGYRSYLDVLEFIERENLRMSRRAMDA